MEITKDDTDFSVDPAILVVKGAQLKNRIHDISEKYVVTLQGDRLELDVNEPFRWIKSEMVVFENGKYRVAAPDEIKPNQDPTCDEAINAPTIQDVDDDETQTHFVDVLVWIVIGFTGVSVIVIGGFACYHIRKKKKKH